MDAGEYYSISSRGQRLTLVIPFVYQLGVNSSMVEVIKPSVDGITMSRPDIFEDEWSLS